MHEFSLTDRKGVSHAYILHLHPGTEGAAIAAALNLAGLGPLGEALQGLLAEGGSVKDLLDSPDLLKSLKAGEFGTKLAASLRGLDLAALSGLLLGLTTRDGERLGNRAVFDKAFAGNYGELAQAAWRSIALNGFLPLLDMITAGE